MPSQADLTLAAGASNNGVMTAHGSRLSFSLDPLMAEAKRRARQRRVIVSAAGLVALALALALFLAFGTGGSGSGKSGAASTRGGISPNVGQLVSLTVHRPVYFVGGGGISKPPGGAALRHEHQLVRQPTPVGLAAIWVAPDWAVRGTCAWLTIRRAVYGGECRHAPPPRGLWELVPLRLRINGKFVTLLWGHAGTDVASLMVRYHDGTTTRLPLTNGVFFRVLPNQSWRVGHRPEWVIARGKDGSTLRVQLVTKDRFPKLRQG